MAAAFRLMLMQTSSQITVRRLNWAGVEIVRDQQRILIDPIENAEPFEHLLGKPRHPLEPGEAKRPIPRSSKRRGYVKLT